MKLLPMNHQWWSWDINITTVKVHRPPNPSAPIPTSSKYSHKSVSARINHFGMRTDKIVHIFLTTCTSSLKRFNFTSLKIGFSDRSEDELKSIDGGIYRLWNVINQIFWRRAGRVFTILKISVDLDEKINLIKACVVFWSCQNQFTWCTNIIGCVLTSNKN